MFLHQCHSSVSNLQHQYTPDAYDDVFQCENVQQYVHELHYACGYGCGHDCDCACGYEHGHLNDHVHDHVTLCVCDGACELQDGHVDEYGGHYVDEIESSLFGRGLHLLGP